MKRELIEKTLEKLFIEIPLQPSLADAARYSLFSGGKRLRPLLVLEVADAYDVPLEHAVQPACALECIHTYSLIHDDLPSMDNDDVRRGKPTLHKAYPEGLAILTGDFLLTHAFYLLSHAPHLTPIQRLSLIQLLSQTAGAQGMIGGQVADISLDKKLLNWEEIYSIHQNKTAALIATSLSFGALIANAPEEQQKLLHEAGIYLGIAFQLVDDLMDADTSIPKNVVQHHIDNLFSASLDRLHKLPCAIKNLCAYAEKCIYRVQ